MTPAQPPVPGGDLDIWAFRAFGDRQALLADGNGRVWRFNGTAWQDLGIWRTGGYTDDVDHRRAGNVWACGTGGAARRDAETGAWQRYRVTNTSQYDSFNADLTLDPATGRLWACANAGPGIGGATHFDGTRWIGFNNYTYGLGVDWPFPTDNSQAVGFRPSSGSVAVNPDLRRHPPVERRELDQPERHERESRPGRGLAGPALVAGQLLRAALPQRDELDLGAEQRHLGATTSSAILDRPGTVWVSTYAEVIRTDGSYRFSRTYGQFPEMNTQSDIFSTVAAGPNGTAWLGATPGLFKLDANTGSYEFFTELGGYSCVGASPLAVTPDGRVWFAMFDPGGWNGTPHGLLWFDGVNAGYFPAPVNGEPQWGGLPHAQIRGLQVRPLPNGYELWMICVSRGIAVLSVEYADPTAVGPSAALPGLLLEPSAPNPFRSSTTLSFSLPGSDRVEIGIYDVQGRQIRQLMDDRLAGGPSAVTWDGKDEAGQSVVSGVYFWKLKATSGEASQRMVLLR